MRLLEEALGRLRGRELEPEIEQRAQRAPTAPVAADDAEAGVLDPAGKLARGADIDGLGDQVPRHVGRLEQ